MEGGRRLVLIKYENYQEYEQKRTEYMNRMKRMHNDVLKMQIEDKEKQRGKNMNTLELLYNKSLLKDLGKEN